MSVQVLRQAAEKARATKGQSYIADWLDEVVVAAEEAEQWCPDLVREGCDCDRCQEFRPALVAAEAVLNPPP